MFYGRIPTESTGEVAYDKFDEILPGFSMVEATFEHLRGTEL